MRRATIAAAAFMLLVSFTQQQQQQQRKIIHFGRPERPADTPFESKCDQVNKLYRSVRALGTHRKLNQLVFFFSREAFVYGAHSPGTEGSGRHMK